MMTRSFLSISLATLLAGVAVGQPQETGPKFVAADIHKSVRTNQPVMRGPFFGASRYEVRFASMLDMVRLAYDVDPERVSGGPNWLEMDRFDVFAKAPGGSNAESRKLMLRALLAERFHLVTHSASKPLAAFALTAGKHAGLKEADESGESGCKFEGGNAGPPPAPPAPGAPQTITLPTFVYTCKNTTMKVFASALAGIPGGQQYLGGKPVVDQTDLKGAWDFTLRYTPKVPAAIQVTGESIPLMEAVEKQLGLKLEASTVPAPMIVVDSVDRTPTQNPANIDEILPPLPKEFDVAEIKVSPPQTGPRPANLQPEVKNGRIYVPGITLQNLIQLAWDLNGDEFLVGAPKWLNDDKFDIIAKAPAEVAMGDLNPSSRSIPVNIDALRPMIKALIVTRFKMQTHMEERPLNAYVLTAPKPKLTKAEVDERTKWLEGPAPDNKNAKNVNTALGRLVTCQNVSMAEFAGMLPGIAPGYLRTEVVDKTGLEGGWDFTFSFSPAGLLNLGGGRGGDSAEAADPNGAISLFDAMTKQLGLKLDMQKRPAPVLVIDRIERTPTDN